MDMTDRSIDSSDDPNISDSPTDSGQVDDSGRECDSLPFGGSHAPLCPYRCGGECLCWRSDPDLNPDLEVDPC